MSQRMARVDELLQQEIGSIISLDLSDPRLGFATVTEVETSPDLRHARVWISVIGQPQERKASVEVLEHAEAFIRRELGTRLRLKRIPELHFRLDDSAERGTRVLHLLNELEAGNEPNGEPAAPAAETLPTPVQRLPHDGDAPLEMPGIEQARPAKRRRTDRRSRDVARRAKRR
jgi:ribosome-binding factor A